MRPKALVITTGISLTLVAGGVAFASANETSQPADAPQTASQVTEGLYGEYELATRHELETRIDDAVSIGQLTPEEKDSLLAAFDAGTLMSQDLKDKGLVPLAQ